MRRDVVARIGPQSDRIERISLAVATAVVHALRMAGALNTPPTNGNVEAQTCTEAGQQAPAKSCGVVVEQWAIEHCRTYAARYIVQVKTLLLALSNHAGIGAWSDLTREHVAAFVAHLAESGRVTKGKRRLQTCWRQWFTDRPTKKSNRKREKVLTEGQIQAILMLSQVRQWISPTTFPTV